jgi:hypothetical protein
MRPTRLINQAGSATEESIFLETCFKGETIMAILTSTPGAENKVSIYDVPDSVLSQYAVTGDKAAQMFPESKKTSGAEIPKSGGANSVKVENAESLGEVQAYGDICVCRELLCNAYGCWWHYYYCYC